jgi:Ca2+-binding EF-hand superfamily protein
MRWTLAFATLALAAAVQAGEKPASPPAGRNSVDANADGIVTREEAQAHPRFAGQFDAVDTNKDGKLDAAEMNVHREAMRGQRRAEAQARWTAADKDGDGAISRQEADESLPGLAGRFDSLDANRDGKVGRDEMHNARMRERSGKGKSEQL